VDGNNIPLTAESSESDDDIEPLSSQDPNLKQFGLKPKLSEQCSDCQKLVE